MTKYNFTEPTVISDHRSANVQSTNDLYTLTDTETDDKNKTSGYKIILNKDKALQFMKEVKKVKSGSKSHTIKIDNSQDYAKVATNIKNTIDALEHVSSNIQNLKNMYIMYSTIATNDNYYKFDKEINCLLSIDGSIVEGQIIAIDNGTVAVIKTQNKLLGVVIDNQLEIKESLANSSHVSESIYETEFETQTESPQTESLTESSIATSKFVSESPYLATSEYEVETDEILDTSPKEDPRTKKKKKSDTLNISSSISSISSSNKSEYVKQKSNMKGGFFMKAGKGDKVGIIETNDNYYSESSSIEEGLCE